MYARYIFHWQIDVALMSQYERQQFTILKPISRILILVDVVSSVDEARLTTVSY